MNALLQQRETWSQEFEAYFARSWRYGGESVCRGRVETDSNPHGLECGEPAFEKTGLCQEHYQQMVQRIRESFDKRARDICEQEIRDLIRLRSVFPKMPFASSENPGFMTGLPAPLKAFVGRFSPRSPKNLLVLGKTSDGKSASVCAMADRVISDETKYLHSLSAEEVERLLTKARDAGNSKWFESELSGAVWMPALELALDSKRHPLGQGESPLTTKAKQARILFLDDLGQELTVDRDRAILEVLDARYREGGSRPTIANTGLTREEFQRSYGAHVYRRLAGKDSGGSSIDLYGQGHG